jgi:hypothetical protein
MAENYPDKLTGSAADKRLDILAFSSWPSLPVRAQVCPVSQIPLGRKISL